jgi:hypothetical protein
MNIPGTVMVLAGEVAFIGLFTGCPSVLKPSASRPLYPANFNQAVKIATYLTHCGYTPTEPILSGRAKDVVVGARPMPRSCSGGFLDEPG